MAQQHSLQWKHRGKRGFVIGGGASILTLQNDGFDFEELAREEVIVGVNKAYKLCPLDFLASIDIDFLNESSEAIKGLDCFKVMPDICIKHYDEDDLSVIPITDTCRQQGRGHHKRSQPPTKFHEFCYVGGSGLFGIKVAYILGLNPIYLIGFDCIRVEGRSHFHDDYLNTSRDLVECTDNRLKQASIPMLQFAAVLRKFFQNPVQVYSCSPISILNSEIPYRDLQEVLHA